MFGDTLAVRTSRGAAHRTARGIACPTDSHSDQVIMIPPSSLTQLALSSSFAFASVPLCRRHQTLVCVCVCVCVGLWVCARACWVSFSARMRVHTLGRTSCHTHARACARTWEAAHAHACVARSNLAHDTCARARAQFVSIIYACMCALKAYPSHTPALHSYPPLATHHMRLHLRAVSARLLSTTYARMRALKHPPQTFSDVMSQAELASRIIHPLVSGSLH